MDKTLAEIVMERLIEATIRAVKAEDELAKTKENEEIWRNASIRRDAEIDALNKEVEQLRAKLRAFEGMEEVINADRV